MSGFPALIGGELQCTEKLRFAQRGQLPGERIFPNLHHPADAHNGRCVCPKTAVDKRNGMERLASGSIPQIVRWDRLLSRRQAHRVATQYLDIVGALESCRVRYVLLTQAALHLLNRLILVTL